MIGLEVTAQALVTLDDLTRLRALNSERARIAAALIEPTVHWWITNMNWSGGQVYDACAVAALIAPDILRTQPMYVEIELHGTYTRGRTVADISGWQKHAPNVDVGVSLQRDRFLEILLEGLR
jgi:inosine-uridine nucleoside N-ribohydrolase